MKIIWCMFPEIGSMTDRLFLSFLAIFCFFTPLTTLKNQLLDKRKYKPGDIFLLNKSTKNYNHMLYRSWDMAHDGCNFLFFFQLIFALLKQLEMTPFYPCVPKIIIIYYTVPEIQCFTDLIFIFYFELLFARLKHLDISPFYSCVPKIRIRGMVSEILTWQTDW